VPRLRQRVLQTRYLIAVKDLVVRRVGGYARRMRTYKPAELVNSRTRCRLRDPHTQTRETRETNIAVGNHRVGKFVIMDSAISNRQARKAMSRCLD
jgi:hypothetical protein